MRVQRIGLSSSKTYIVTLESVQGEADDYALYLIGLGMDPHVAYAVVGSLPHSLYGLDDDDSHLVQTALQAWGGNVSNTLDKGANARTTALDLFPKLAAPAITMITSAPSPSPLEVARESEPDFEPDFEPEATVDMAVGHLADEPHLTTAEWACAPPDTHRWMGTILIAAAAYAVVAGYGCAATWHDEHEFNEHTHAFASMLGEVQENTGRVGRSDVADVVVEIARAAGVSADVDEIEIYAFYLDSERRKIGTAFDCSVEALPREYNYLSVPDRMRLNEQIAHCKDAWVVGFRVPLTARRAFKTLRFEGVKYSWIESYEGEPATPESAR